MDTWVDSATVKCGYYLASSGRGMRTEQIAEKINRERLHLLREKL